MMNIDAVHIGRASQERRPRVFLEEIEPPHISLSGADR
jgi:hypothetical protein